MSMETKPNDSYDLQEPYTLRCIKPFEVFNELYGEDGIDEEYLYVDAGTYWEILGLVSGRYVRLYGMGEMAGLVYRPRRRLPEQEFRGRSRRRIR